MNKFIYSVFLILLTLIIVSTSGTTVIDKPTIIDKRSSNKCSCTVAIADFDGSFGKVKGLITYSQDEFGCTIVTGIFSKGFDDEDTRVQIVDRRGNLLHDLTEDLDIEIYGNGSTKAFVHRFEDLNLDCDSEGILLVEPQDSQYYKRQLKSPEAGSDTQTVADGHVTGKAPNEQVPSKQG